MTVLRKPGSANSLILVAICTAAASAGVLFTFPADPVIWQVATWILVAALLGLLILVAASGYALATDAAARTWRRIACFLAGMACLVPVAVGLF